MNASNERRIGSILGYIYTIVHSAISLIYIPLLLRGIGDSEYGLYQIMGSIIAYFAIMETPLSSSILRYYSFYKERNDSINMENTLAIGRRIFRCISVILVIAIIPVLFLIRLVYSSTFSVAELNESYAMMIVMVINTVISANSYIYIAAINANERYIFLKISNLVSTVLQPICVILVIQHHPYALSIVIVQTIFNLVLSIIRWLFATKVNSVRVKYHGRNRELVHSIFRLTASVLFIALADQIFWKTDQLILGAYKNTSTVAVYSVGAQINNMFISIGCVLSGMILPLATRAEINDDEKNSKLFSIFVDFGRYQSYLVFLLLSGVILYGKEFILILTNENYIEAYYVALLLMIPYTIDIIQNSGCVILQVKDKYHYRSYVLFSMAIINIGLTIVFVSIYGMIGAALATTITIILGSGIIMNYLYKKLLHFDLRTYWLNIAPIFLASVISFVVGYCISKISFSNIIIQFVFHVVCYTSVYVLCTYTIAMNKDEKSFVRSIIKKICKK